MSEFKNQDSAEAVIIIKLQSGRNDSHKVVWFVAKGKATPMKSEDPAALDASLQGFSDSSEFQPFYMNIQVITKADADKIGESSPGSPFGE